MAYLRTRVRLPPPPPLFLGNLRIRPHFPAASSISPLANGRSVDVVSKSRIAASIGRAQVHVALRRAEILMAGELLDGPNGRTTHRQMRAECVTKDVTPALTFARRAARRSIT